MSERFYKVVCALGCPAISIASRPLILHAERAARPGAYLLAGNHESVFDAPMLIHASPRVIHWLSGRQIFKTRFARWFMEGMCATLLDRTKADPAGAKAILRKLQAGCVVGFFPSGGVRRGADSVLQGGPIHDGVARMAQLAGAPVMPCVALEVDAFRRWQSWLPLRRTRWGVAFGEVIHLRPELEGAAARAALLEDWRRAVVALAEELRAGL